jgi:single-strand DNA-binding protein
MSRSLNKVMLIGNVGAEPEIRTTGSGTRVAKVSLATNRRFNDRSGQAQEKTEWHRLTFWDRMAELVEQYVKKGDRLYIEGRLEYSQTEDEHGNVRYWTDIVVQEMIMLGASGPGGGFDAGQPQQRRRAPAGGGPPQSGGGSPFDADDDDLPF